MLNLAYNNLHIVSTCIANSYLGGEANRSLSPFSVSRARSKRMVILIAGEIAEGSCDQETERNSHGLSAVDPPPFPILSLLLWRLDKHFVHNLREADRRRKLEPNLPLSLRLPMRQCMMDRQIAATEWDFKFCKSPPSDQQLWSTKMAFGFRELQSTDLAFFHSTKPHFEAFGPDPRGHPGGRKTGRCHYTAPSSSSSSSSSWGERGKAGKAAGSKGQ